ncbi:MAG: protease modulator HflC [Pseudomonadota bacterium]|nr:protease modulator HflC [Pseudomonadota bacterium]
MSRGIMIAVAVVLVAFGIVATSAVYTVHETRQALVLQFGEPVRVDTEPGLYFKLPIMQNVVEIEKRILSLDIEPAEVIARDQKRIVVDAFARYRVTDPLRFYQTVRTAAIARERLQPLLISQLRAVLGGEDFATLLTGERKNLMERIAAQMNERTAELGVAVVDVRIKRADLPESNKEAIFNRMQTERQREAREERALGDEEARRITARAERDRTVLLAEARKQSEILRGEGDGSRARIFNQVANRDPEFYAFYRSLQAYRTALGTDDTTMVLNPNSDFFKFFQSLRQVAPGSANPAN